MSDSGDVYWSARRADHFTSEKEAGLVEPSGGRRPPRGEANIYILVKVGHKKFRFPILGPLARRGIPPPN